MTVNHYNMPREKEADNSSDTFEKFNDFIKENHKGQSIEKLFNLTDSDVIRINTLDMWWNSFNNNK